MQIKFLISGVLLASIFACGATTANDASTKKDQDQTSSLGFKLSTGEQYNIAVERDDTVAQDTRPRKVKIIGEIPKVAVILIDTYPSIPGGMSYCQAGEERFLRVVSLTKSAPEETFHVKLESCRNNIELASPGIDWLPESSKLVIHWLQGPIGGKAETRILTIDKAGNVK